MPCSRCGASVAPDFVYCPRCGIALGGPAGMGSMQHRREAALAAFREGRDAAGVQCPNCGRYRMRPVRIDADANLIFGFVFVVLGIIAFGLVLFDADAGLYVADASMVGVAFALIGVLFFAVARRRRRPSAFECFSCGYRVP